MPGPTRRAALSLAATTLAAPALAQGRFPDRPVRLIIPWPPGGSADAQLRSLAELAGRTLGQPVVAENRAGASGTLGAQFLTTQARPDGYALAQMHLSVIRRPFLVRNPPWDPVQDFTHIIGLTGWLFGIVVKADGPIKSWADYIAYAKAHPGRLTYATSGIATTNHLTMEELSAKEGVELTHVPYRASNEAAVSVASGEVMSVADSSAWAPLVDSGALRLICVWTAERSPRFPQAPTLKELGHDMVGTSPYGIAGPKGMDPGVVRSLHEAFKAALFDSANAAVRAQFDMPLEYYDPEAYRDFVARRAAYERTMAERLNLRID
ncbi:tripartite tricarboxylate transporter substrate binding protein [Siccirubricoccus sp. KC 17139]|uniref:Tripartite tricarboxylate transporter substrate binding protein n=1 Tax=Siccirubricoccus soli TaxID=2899147 RepID=A0ABT1D0A3_9PROT|nr:tripartite tricarboxylate transporter substrate binding protein [Siccirubricoccus soli]MCO6415348.1 tripartite tricarboxylate transporter substrate binding protein [Siccirubricoccus soli]MCP2681480.1 tripartite tricarboxylate transporter substrate binding protein [Siccirubricoccus soli]